MEMSFVERLNLFENWGLENDTIFETGKFSVLWGCFEWKYFNNNCNKEKIDQAMQTININQNLISSCGEIINELKVLYNNDTKVIIERLRCNKMTKEINKCLNNKDIDNLSLLQGALYICYRIRNNMFHGEKCEFFLDRQRNLFININIFLTELLIIKC